MTTTHSSLAELRHDLSRRTGRGINAIIAGIGLWSIFAGLGLIITDDFILALTYVFGSGLLFPLSLAVAKAMRLDPYAKGNELGVLAGLLGGVQTLFIPLMVGATFVSPEVVPWFLAVLVGAHLLPFTWVYHSRAYLTAAIALPLVAGLIGWLLPAWVPIAVPVATVALLFLTAVRLHRANLESKEHP